MQQLQLTFYTDNYTQIYSRRTHLHVFLTQAQICDSVISKVEGIFYSQNMTANIEAKLQTHHIILEKIKKAKQFLLEYMNQFNWEIDEKKKQYKDFIMFFLLQSTSRKKVIQEINILIKQINRKIKLLQEFNYQSKAEQQRFSKQQSQKHQSLSISKSESQYINQRANYNQKTISSYYNQHYKIYSYPIRIKTQEAQMPNRQKITVNFSYSNSQRSRLPFEVMKQRSQYDDIEKQLTVYPLSYSQYGQLNYLNMSNSMKRKVSKKQKIQIIQEKK